MKNTNIVLVVAAHPDDEVLGCGGTMARHVDAGDAVHVLFLSDGVSSRGSAQGLAERNEAAEKASEVLGVDSTTYGTLPDNKMDNVALLDVVQVVEACISKIQPNIIYTHHNGDLNIDHRIAVQAVMTACRPQSGHPVEEIYSFEIPSSTEWQSPDFEPRFSPSYFVDISQSISRKMDALKAYDMEMRTFPHSRSYEAVEALATVHGARNGMKAAEAFMVQRILKR